MTQRDLAHAKDPDLRGSLQAIRRAALQARQIAIQTGTCIVIVQNNKIVHITAEELKQGR